MPPKSKESGKKPSAVIQRQPISDSSLLCVPGGAVEGYQERINTGIEWSLVEKAACYHKEVCQREDIPTVTFSEALQKKLDQSILNGLLKEDTNISLEDYRDLIIPIILWDQDKFSSEEGKICFRKINSVTDDLPKLIKETCKAGKRGYMRKALKRVHVLRLADTNMTDLDDGLLNYKSLVNLNLCGNFIQEFDAQWLPPTLKTLELHANRVKTLQNIAPDLPSELIYLGLSRNLLNDEFAPTLLLLPYKLTVLDLSNNDICNIEPVVTALGKLPNLNSLALIGNPCALCAGYSRYTLHMLPRLLWLDYREVLPSDRPVEPFEVHPDDLRATHFYFTVFRVMSAPQPPKAEKGATAQFHVEVELPLLDSQRRNFLMFRRNESLVEILPPPEDDSPRLDQRPSMQQPRLSQLERLTEQSSHASDIYKNPVAKNSREVLHYRKFESNRVQWAKLMNFQEPAVKIFCPDLVALRDTFRTVVTARLVYTLVTSNKPVKEKEKRLSHAHMPPRVPGEQRVVLAEVNCTLKQPDWSQPSQHFHWDTTMDTKQALHWGDGDLSVLHYTYVTSKSLKGTVEVASKFPEGLTIHLGFGVDISSGS